MSQVSRSILFFSKTGNSAVKNSLGEIKQTYGECRFTLRLRRILSSQSSSGQSSVNRDGKSKTQQESSRFAVKSSTLPTSKNGLPTSVLLRNGRKPATSPGKFLLTLVP